ncbi:FYVE and coiled-coil domain-containing protein 1 [Bagarius yarrelli]|uniref:FYVE and coiled-coil domain-containing protein 1 n=1 Tax=Bagarius yarrelli TaxID=175774 RepID=A0A556VA26_BAGYA|nr:FYVE and coiled-coil domain-containing protein 1 [Bagarius yarrelli]
MASLTVGENQLQRIIRDLHEAVAELTKEHVESGEPVTDDSPSLHKFCYKLEYLLQLKTSLGKGRAFIRYCLVHQRLADTLQQCLMNQKVTCDWYYARSPFLKSYLNVDIINHLYELNEIQFDVASRGYDLDSQWPTFARRTVGSAVSGAHMWRPPSRCSSVNSLVSNYSQQVQECLPGPDSSFQADLGELGELSLSAVDDLRVELDQSELQKQQLQEQIYLLTQEAAELKQQVSDLGVKLLAAESANHKACNDEAPKDSFMQEAVVKKLEAGQNTEDLAKQVERLSQELRAQGEKLKESEEALVKLRTSSEKEGTISVQQIDELQGTVSCLTEALTLKEQQAKNLQVQLQDMQSLLQERDQQLEKVKSQAKLKQEEFQRKSSSLKETLDSQIEALHEQLKAKEIELLINTQKIQQLENQTMESQKLEEYKTQCVSLMEINAQLISTVKRSEERNKELTQTKTALERELTCFKASERLFVEENTQKSQMSTETSMKELANGPCSRENKPLKPKLDLNMKEVSRLQEEVVDLRARLQVTSEEKIKLQALQEVTESSKADLSSQTKQLKSQVEDLNRRHIEELLHSQEKEELLEKKSNDEAQARANLQIKFDSIKEELDMLKRQNDALASENEEAREALHRANTETAELGIQVCMLTGQNEEARLRWEELSAKLQELLLVQTDTQILTDTVENLRKENARFQEELKEAQGLTKTMKELQERFDGAKEETISLQKSNQEKLNAVQFQLNETTTNYQNQIKDLNEELLHARSQMEAEQEKVSTLETRLAQLEANNSSLSVALEEKNDCIAKSDILFQQKEEQLKQLQSDLAKAQEELALTQKACQDLSENLHRAITEKETCDLKSSAEIDDLYRTKRNLEERLIELIREKDVLWQKSDALEFEQKLRAEEQTDRELPHCSECHTQFSWLCGRPFCYYCCSSTVSMQQGGVRERCCKDCYTRHGAGERHPQEELGSPSRVSYSPLCSTPTRASMPSVAVALQSPRPDDAVFDIITDEEVNCIYDNDTLPYTTALSLESGQQETHDISSSTSGGDLTADESEELPTSPQNAEICLLKSGEITLSVPFGGEEIFNFGQDFRELFIKSSCYSLIPITVDTAGPVIRWVFSSAPKSISFSVVYRESTDTPLEQAKVLIPLTRCDSHKEEIKGQMKARNRGEYTLIFDNSFSRFISKKVLYRLSAEEAVVYDSTE